MAKTNHWGTLAVAAGTLVAVALLVLMLVLANPQPAGAALPGTNGRIAYSGQDAQPGQTDSEIFTIPATGGTDALRNQVTQNGVPDTQPSYSPDGNTIAYSGPGGIPPGAQASKDFEIWTIPATGGTPPFQLTDDVVETRQPSYSPAGNMIAYSEGNLSNPFFEIWKEPATGGGAFGLNSNPLPDERGPSWTTKRQQIAFYSPDQAAGQSDWEIYTSLDVAIPGVSTARKVTDNNSDDAWPDYRPDGRRIVFSGHDGNDWEIFDVRRPTGLIWQPHQLTFNNTDDFHPVYSPDGGRIAYSGRDAQGGQTDWEIFTIPATGGTPFQVTHNNTLDWEPSWQPR